MGDCKDGEAVRGISIATRGETEPLRSLSDVSAKGGRDAGRECGRGLGEVEGGLLGGGDDEAWVSCQCLRLAFARTRMVRGRRGRWENGGT